MIEKLPGPLLAAMCLLLTVACSATADLAAIKNIVARQEAGSSSSMTVAAGTQCKVYAGDRLTVYGQGCARLDMGCCMLDIFINTELKCEEIPKKNTPLCIAELAHGTVYVQCEDRITINAGWATITNLGSAFWVHMDDVRGIVWIIVKLGVVEVSAAGETVQVNAGQQTWVYRGQRPLLPRPATREEVGDLFAPVEELTNNELQDPDLLRPAEVPSTPTGMPPVVRANVSLWHAWPDNEVWALDEAIEAFQTQRPDVRFELRPVPLDQMRAAFERAVRSGSGPTLLMAEPHWGPAWFDAGLVADMSTLVSGDLLSRLKPMALEGVRYRDALVGLPYALKGVVMYRDRSIIPSAPGTFEDLLEMASAYTKGNVLGADLERGFFYSGAHLNGIGGRLMYDNGDPAFLNSWGTDWVNLLQQFPRFRPAEYNTDEDLARFQAGEAGIIIDGTWNMQTLRNSIGVRLAIDPWPTYREGRLSGYVLAEVIYLNAATRDADQEAALRFIEYLLSPENEARLATTGRIPAVDDVPIDDPLMQQAVEVLKGGTLIPARPEWDVYWDPMDTALRAIFEQQAPVRSALITAAEEIAQALKRMREGGEQ
jgi:arabinogalactan oligomer/maltooligosaccharide transport system substrate-binding protein